MRENTLVKVLIIVGVVSLSLIVVSNLLLQNITIGFFSKMIPPFICVKDYEGNYYLGKSTSYSLCSRVNDMPDVADKPEICDGFEGEKKTACLGLIEIVKERKADCLSLIFGSNKTSVSQEEVKMYCEILNVTIPNITSSK